MKHGKEMMYFKLIIIPYYKISLKSRRNLEARTQVEAMEKHSLLACSPSLVQPVFLYKPGPVCGSGVASSTTGWTLPHQSLNKKMPPRIAHKPL